MSPTAARRTAASIVAAVLALEVAAVCLTAGENGLAEAVLYLIYAVTQAGAGALIVHRFPRHPIGWLLLLYALENSVVADFAQAYGVRAAHDRWPLAALAQLFGLTSWIFAASGLILLFLLFPDGRLPDRRWRAVVWAWGIGAVLAIPGWALDPRLGGDFVGGVNPYARARFPTGLLFGVGAGLISAALIASVVALVVRLRRARGAERDQLKWVVLAATLVGIVLPISAALWTVWAPIQLLAAVALVLLPISACVAILRHRLYDVDLVIVRTVAYVVIAALLGAVYVAVALTAAGFLSAPAAAAGAALVVAVTFRPVHDAVQSLADQWLRPARHRAVIATSEFVDALRGGDATVVGLQNAFRRALRDDQLALLLELPDGVIVDPEGRNPSTVPETDGAGRRTLRVSTAAGATAVLSHRDGDERLVTAVADAGALAIEIAAFQVQLRRHLLEVEASRLRIQSVADEERRRIARDLHDGAQQRLVAIGLTLRHAQLRADRAAGTVIDGPVAGLTAAIDEAVAELATSIDELRELAGGLRPGSLDEGLGTALRELAARTPVRLDVCVLPERFPSHVETAAYFVACEAVTNAVKHAEASQISLILAREDGSLVVTVVDDGRGGAEPHRGTGLLGLADRIRAHHGHLQVDSPLGGGTRLEARLPCG
jgi:signal transduction histidine kinase